MIVAHGEAALAIFLDPLLVCLSSAFKHNLKPTIIKANELLSTMRGLLTNMPVNFPAGRFPNKIRKKDPSITTEAGRGDLARASKSRSLRKW